MMMMITMVMAPREQWASMKNQPCLPHAQCMVPIHMIVSSSSSSTKHTRRVARNATASRRRYTTAAPPARHPLLHRLPKQSLPSCLFVKKKEREKIRNIKGCQCHCSYFVPCLPSPPLFSAHHPPFSLVHFARASKSQDFFYFYFLPLRNESRAPPTPHSLPRDGRRA